MRKPVAFLNLTAVCFAAVVVFAFCSMAVADATVSYTGTLAAPDQPALFTFTLGSAATVTLQTFGFGGGVNAAGTIIPSGGTDPFLAIFSGTGNSASIVTDGLGNPYGTSLDLTNYADFIGCPPAGTTVIGGSPVCGDIRMSLTLLAGTYTVVLGDGQYIAYAVFDNGALGEGFADLTGGNFCNLVINGVDCPNTSGDYALDITTAGVQQPVPEPATLVMLAGGLAMGCWRKRARRLLFILR